ncbi:MAG: AAA family ATPase [Fervidicoccaceae archaeon]|nr:AAA family ATPase [Fervidicoccaceae archaeon]
MSEVKLKFRNIGIFRESKEFRLGKGLNVIYAPNASGKSSLTAAIKAVSIPVSNKREASRILNDYENRGLVSLSLDNFDIKIELIRTSPSEVEVLGKPLSNNGVVRVISFLDLENPLVSAVYAGDEERVKQTLREISGLNYIETIVSVLNGLKAEYEHQYEVKSKEYEARKSEVEKEISRIEEELRKIYTKINEILKDTRIEPARKEIERIEKELKKLEEEESQKRSEEIELRNRLSAIDIDQRKLKAKFEVLKEKFSQLKAERDQITSKINEFKKRIEEIDTTIKSLNEEKNKISSEAKELESILKRRETVVIYDYCPYCGAKIDKNKINEDINDLKTKISVLKEKIVSLDKEINLLETEKRELKREVEERLRAIDEELKKLEPEIASLQKEIDAYNKMKSSVERKLQVIETEIKMIKDKIEILVKQLESFKEIPLVKELESLYEERSRLTETRDRLYGRLKQIDQLYGDVVKLKEIINKADLLLEYFNIRLVELKKLVVEKVNEALLKHFKLLDLAELEYPVLSEGFELRLLRKEGVPTTLAELSDAEKAILTILLTLALKEYVADDFPFYVVDSLIEFIDDARAKEVLKYLMDFANSSNTIVIVTKTKPYTGEQRLLTQEDILLNQINI